MRDGAGRSVWIRRRAARSAFLRYQLVFLPPTEMREGAGRKSGRRQTLVSRREPRAPIPYGAK
jgi:hypothetical protein